MRHGATWSCIVLLLAACATRPAPSPSPSPSPSPLLWPTPRVAALRFIFEAERAIEANYVTALDYDALLRSCRRGMLELPAVSAVVLDAPKRPTDTQDALFDQVWLDLRRFEARGTSATEFKQIGQACVRTMTGTLEVGSRFLDEEEYQELLGNGLRAAGIGLEISKAYDHYPQITRALESGPADKAGLMRGDLVVTIDGTPTLTDSLNDVIAKLRGEAGSKITLQVERAGTTGALTFELRREHLKPLPSVESRSPAPGYPLIRIRSFQSTAMQQAVSALGTIYATGRPNGLVLDLRGNSGGLLKPCLGIAAIFLQPGAMIATTRGRANNANQQYASYPERYVEGNQTSFLQRLPDDVQSVPMVVIVDRVTASGAEIVAASLQDHHRARVVGQRTFGNGTIQTVIPLTDGTALRLATANVYRVDGVPLDAWGVIPDLVVDDPSESPVDDEAVNAALAALGYSPPPDRRFETSPVAWQGAPAFALHHR